MDNLMEKLEPVIKHRFWVIFGLTLPITLWAYFSASGKMADATTQQESLLERTYNEVPQGVSEPNQTFAAGASKINERLRENFSAQVQELWESQTSRMTWPKVIVSYIPDEYRAKIDTEACYTYVRVYPSVIQRVWERVQPYVGDPKASKTSSDLVEVTWPQKVLIDGHSLPHATFIKSLPAKSEDIWDAQEDIWLLELIFDAVVKTNEGATFVSDAPVRQIFSIKLVGGSGQSSVTAAGTAGGSYGDEYGEDDSGEGNYGGGGFGGGGGAADIKFSVSEEFGPQVPAASEGAVNDDPYGAEDDDGYGGGGGRGGKMKRYIGTSSLEEGPYRERGFYMSVLILQDSIPAFLSELSSSPWPIRIGRFHIGPNPHAAQKSTGGNRFGGPMAFGGGGGYGEDEGMDDSFDEGSYGGFGGGFGGFGGGFGGQAALELPSFMKLPTSIDGSLRADPDLVQMDFCGIITMYNPQTDDSVKAVDDGSTEEDFTEALENSAATPEAAAAVEAAAQAEAAAAGVDPAAVGVLPAAPGSIPANQPPAVETPPATDDPTGAAAPGESPPLEGTDTPGQ